MTRPNPIKARRYHWLAKRQETPGIAIIGEHGILAHMTMSEALKIAHEIADILQAEKSRRKASSST
ncbi:hypothetical protein [Enteractinococcus helveticum]|uniref:Uncharacterized protein n=1 Tax=Enteractinococcus helveticum TaxID=1837282 RepID=A0A1B7LWX3_9MICC|nr:hypothetical protein [Enteractinococcus helveticum]OAV59552.1 hypothetical protein A6F49_17120 [Enteractinococcus helveticum]